MCALRPRYPGHDNAASPPPGTRVLRWGILKFGELFVLFVAFVAVVPGRDRGLDTIRIGSLFVNSCN